MHKKTEHFFALSVNCLFLKSFNFMKKTDYSCFSFASKMFQNQCFKNVEINKNSDEVFQNFKCNDIISI